VSSQTIAELNEVLRRPGFEKYLSEAQRLEFLESLLRVADLIEVSEVVTECRDPKDNKFLELALSGEASHVITGDHDLLTLHPFHEIAIVDPKSFIAIANLQGP